MGCSKTRKEAKAHMAALQIAAEKENKTMDAEQMRMEIKNMMASGMPAQSYAQQECWDIQNASNILSMVESLMQSELDEPEDLAKLEAVENGLIEYILSEKKERAEALASGKTEGEYETEKSLKAEMEKRKDIDEADKERAKEKYGDVEFADEKNEKYALGNKEEIEAAWKYIHTEKDRKFYSKEELDAMESRIVSAWKKKIDKAGPPAWQEEKGKEDKKSLKMEESEIGKEHTHEHTHMGKDGMVHTHTHEHDHEDGPVDMHEHDHEEQHEHEHTHFDGTTHSHSHIHDGFTDHESALAHAHSHVDYLFSGEVKPEQTEPESSAEGAFPKSWGDMLVSYGDAVKALDEGVVSGYLVRFSTDKDPDLTGDFFTKDTNFGDAKDSYVWYHHKLPLKTEKGAILPAYTKTLGKSKAILSKDNVGIFVKVSLDMRDEYEKAIYEMAKAGRLGWSSGTLPNLVDREPVGKAYFIKTWILGGDASITPKPAEFRNVVSIKSLSPQAALPDRDVSRSASQDFLKEIDNMDQNQFDAAVKNAVANALAAQKAEEAAVKAKEEEKQSAIREGYKMAVKDFQNGKAPAFNVIERSTDPDHRNGGVDGFRHWIKTGQVNSELIPAPSDANFGFGDGATKAAFNVNDGATGAFMVPDILYGIIQPKRDLISWVRQAPVQHLQTPADHLLIPIENTKMTNFVQTNEQGTYNEDEGTVEQLDVHVYKFTKEVQMTEEFINYNQTNFDAWLANKLARAEATTENNKFGIGAGGATVQGVVTGATTGNTIATTLVIAPSDLTTLVGSLGAGYNVQGETGFLMANKTNWYLRSVQTTGFFAYTQTPAAAGTNAAGYNFGPVGNQGPYGIPAYICDDLQPYTDTSGTLAKTPLIFGNFIYYAVVERPGMMLQRNPYLHMNQGIVSLFASIYRGGGVLQQEAFYGLITK